MNISCLITPYFSGVLSFSPASYSATQIGAGKFQGQSFDFSGGSLAANSPETVLITTELIVVADIRLHNEPEIRSRLGISAQEGTPAQLIARAYQQWGEKISEQFTGEFVFLIWDRRAEKVLVSRDRFGFKSFYYDYQPGSYFAFGNRISHLPTFLPSRKSIDYGKIRNFLAPQNSDGSFEDRTFFKNVKAALPAHQLTIHKNQVAQRCYWKVDPARYRTITREEEYIELFRSYFFDSVRQCTQGYDAPGAHLSGGLDSSSVACVAQQLVGKISTFYIHPDLPSTDERYFVQAVQNQIHSRHYEGRPEADVYGALARLSRLFDRPEHFPIPSTFHFAAAEQVRQAGCDVVLTGHDGDSVVGHGNGLIRNYQEAGDWSSLKRAIYQYAQERDIYHLNSDWLSLRATERQTQYARHYLCTELWAMVRQKKVSGFLKTARALNPELGYSYRDFLNSGLDKLRTRLKFPLPGNLLTHDFAAQWEGTRTSTNADALYTGLNADYQGQFREITHKSYVDATEQLHHIGLHYGHHYAHPFFDEKLVELSLAIPERVKFGDGKGRATIRRALQDILPPEVLNRGHKTSFNEYGLLSFQILHLQTQSIFCRGHLLWDIVDKKKFDKVAGILLNPAIPLNQKSRYYTLASKALFLGVWLEEIKKHEK
ncbi:asparagine synthase-related protein [Persicitalea sp.]|uniref:asparagine synthase-related protein n=1 Tax=Persicitalea sp. TaxID=3100273 RepID=UPI003593C2FF